MNSKRRRIYAKLERRGCAIEEAKNCMKVDGIERKAKGHVNLDDYRTRSRRHIFTVDSEYPYVLYYVI